MISIPADMRKKYKIKDGNFMLVREDEDGTIKISDPSLLYLFRISATGLIFL